APGRAGGITGATVGAPETGGATAGGAAGGGATEATNAGPGAGAPNAAGAGAGAGAVNEDSDPAGATTAVVPVLLRSNESDQSSVLPTITGRIAAPVFLPLRHVCRSGARSNVQLPSLVDALPFTGLVQSYLGGLDGSKFAASSWTRMQACSCAVLALAFWGGPLLVGTSFTISDLTSCGR